MTDYKRYSTMVENYLAAEQNVRTSAQHQSREIITHYQTVDVGIKIPLIQTAITAFLLSVLVMAGSYVKRHSGLDRDVLRRRLVSWLQRRGFPSNIVYAVLRKVLEE